MTLLPRLGASSRPLDASRGEELRQSGEIAGGHRHDEAGTHVIDAAQHRLRHAPGRFLPSKGLFDAFAVLHSGHTKTPIFVAQKLNRRLVADADEKRTDRFFADHGIKPRVVAEAQLSFAICAMVAGGAGVSIVEPVTALHCAHLGMVVARPIRPVQPFTYDILTPALRPASRLVSDLVQRVRQRFAGLAATEAQSPGDRA